jgi:hypothetical protein
MRTTIDLPDDILKGAKIAAVRQGRSLREFVAEALRAELDRQSGNRSLRLRTPPIRLSEDSPLRSLQIADLKQIEAEDEADKLIAVYRGR